MKIQAFIDKLNQLLFDAEIHNGQDVRDLECEIEWMGEIIDTPIFNELKLKIVQRGRVKYATLIFPCNGEN